MNIQHYTYDNAWNKPFDTKLDSSKSVIFVFSSLSINEAKEAIKELHQYFPNSIMVGSSTAGNISQDEILDGILLATVVKFDKTELVHSHVKIEALNDSFQSGEIIGEQLLLNEKKLSGVFVLSDGLNINGSDLTNGIANAIGNDIVVTGGLAGDGTLFKEIWVIIDNTPKEGYVSALGFYGDYINLHYGMGAGWDQLGIDRKITKSDGPVLYELDNKPALSLYKKYLGEFANDLPASGLLFPLNLKATRGEQDGKICGVRGVNEDDQSITFAGSMPEGSYATLMRANSEHLLSAVENSIEKNNYGDSPILCIVVSCIGRRLVLKQRTEEELEIILNYLPQESVLTGFYSYGEISPHKNEMSSFHNQTLTFVSFSEDEY